MDETVTEVSFKEYDNKCLEVCPPDTVETATTDENGEIQVRCEVTCP